MPDMTSIVCKLVAIFCMNNVVWAKDYSTTAVKIKLAHTAIFDNGLVTHPITSI